jgi:1,4-dihydroxy-2-naphthoate octaprenyltransferase
MRLRTLPLSLAGVVLGSLLAARSGPLHAPTLVFLLLTTVCLQILSNLSNELGDFLRGTDGDGRQGPQYSLQSGALTAGDLRGLIRLFAGLCLVFGALMIYFSTGSLMKPVSLALMALGAAAIWAAMHYTLGRNPYGYRGLGDLFVFLFFGLVSVLGSYFVCTKGIGLHWKLLLPASAVGFFSVGVLNVNNIRDMATDAQNRVTVAIKLGEKKAKIYQTVLIGLGWAAMIAYTLLCWPSIWNWMWVLTLPLYVLHLTGIWKRSGKALDPMLPLLVISTFLLCLLTGVGHCMFLF